MSFNSYPELFRKTKVGLSCSVELCRDRDRSCSRILYLLAACVPCPTGTLPSLITFGVINADSFIICARRLKKNSAPVNGRHSKNRDKHELIWDLMVCSAGGQDTISSGIFRNGSSSRGSEIARLSQLLAHLYLYKSMHTSRLSPLSSDRSQITF